MKTAKTVQAGIKPSGKIGQGHVLGLRAFEAICAIEGISLSPASRKRLADMDERKLSQDEKRKEVIRAYREDNSSTDVD